MNAMTLDRFDADFGTQNFRMDPPAFDGIRELSVGEVEEVNGGVVICGIKIAPIAWKLGAVALTAVGSAALGYFAKRQ